MDIHSECRISNYLLQFQRITGQFTEDQLESFKDLAENQEIKIRTADTRRETRELMENSRNKKSKARPAWLLPRQLEVNYYEAGGDQGCGPFSSYKMTDNGFGTYTERTVRKCCHHYHSPRKENHQSEEQKSTPATTALDDLVSKYFSKSTKDEITQTGTNVRTGTTQTENKAFRAKDTQTEAMDANPLDVEKLKDIMKKAVCRIKDASVLSVEEFLKLCIDEIEINNIKDQRERARISLDLNGTFGTEYGNEEMNAFDARMLSVIDSTLAVCRERLRLVPTPARSVNLTPRYENLPQSKNYRNLSETSSEVTDQLYHQCGGENDRHEYDQQNGGQERFTREPHTCTTSKPNENLYQDVRKMYREETEHESMLHTSHKIKTSDDLKKKRKKERHKSEHENLTPVSYPSTLSYYMQESARPINWVVEESEMDFLDDHYNREVLAVPRLDLEFTREDDPVEQSVHSSSSSHWSEASKESMRDWLKGKGIQTYAKDDWDEISVFSFPDQTKMNYQEKTDKHKNVKVNKKRRVLEKVDEKAISSLEGSSSDDSSIPSASIRDLVKTQIERTDRWAIAKSKYMELKQMHGDVEDIFHDGGSIVMSDRGSSVTTDWTSVSQRKSNRCEDGTEHRSAEIVAKPDAMSNNGSQHDILLLENLSDIFDHQGRNTLSTIDEVSVLQDNPCYINDYESVCNDHSDWSKDRLSFTSFEKAQINAFVSKDDKIDSNLTYQERLEERGQKAIEDLLAPDTSKDELELPNKQIQMRIADIEKKANNQDLDSFKNPTGSETKSSFKSNVSNVSNVMMVMTESGSESDENEVHVYKQRTPVENENKRLPFGSSKEKVENSKQSKIESKKMDNKLENPKVLEHFQKDNNNNIEKHMMLNKKMERRADYHKLETGDVKPKADEFKTVKNSNQLNEVIDHQSSKLYETRKQESKGKSVTNNMTPPYNKDVMNTRKGEQEEKEQIIQGQSDTMSKEKTCQEKRQNGSRSKVSQKSHDYQNQTPVSHKRERSSSIPNRKAYTTSLKTHHSRKDNQNEKPFHKHIIDNKAVISMERYNEKDQSVEKPRKPETKEQIKDSSDDSLEMSFTKPIGDSNEHLKQSVIGSQIQYKAKADDLGNDLSMDKTTDVKQTYNQLNRSNFASSTANQTPSEGNGHGKYNPYENKWRARRLGTNGKVPYDEAVKMVRCKLSLQELADRGTSTEVNMPFLKRREISRRHSLEDPRDASINLERSLDVRTQYKDGAEHRFAQRNVLDKRSGLPKDESQNVEKNPRSRLNSADTVSSYDDMNHECNITRNKTEMGDKQTNKLEITVTDLWESCTCNNTKELTLKVSHSTNGKTVTKSKESSDKKEATSESEHANKLEITKVHLWDNDIESSKNKQSRKTVFDSDSKTALKYMELSNKKASQKESKVLERLETTAIESWNSDTSSIVYEPMLECRHAPNSKIVPKFDVFESKKEILTTRKRDTRLGTTEIDVWHSDTDRNIDEQKRKFSQASISSTIQKCKELASKKPYGQMKFQDVSDDEVLWESDDKIVEMKSYRLKTQTVNMNKASVCQPKSQDTLLLEDMNKNESQRRKVDDHTNIDYKASKTVKPEKITQMAAKKLWLNQESSDEGESWASSSDEELYQPCFNKRKNLSKPTEVNGPVKVTEEKMFRKQAEAIDKQSFEDQPFRKTDEQRKTNFTEDIVDVSFARNTGATQVVKTNDNQPSQRREKVSVGEKNTRAQPCIMNYASSDNDLWKKYESEGNEKDIEIKPQSLQVVKTVSKQKKAQEQTSQINDVSRDGDSWISTSENDSENKMETKPQSIKVVKNEREKQKKAQEQTKQIKDVSSDDDLWNTSSDEIDDSRKDQKNKPRPLKIARKREENALVSKQKKAQEQRKLENPKTGEDMCDVDSWDTGSEDEMEIKRQSLIVERSGEKAVSVNHKKAQEQPKLVNNKTGDDSDSWDSEEEMEIKPQTFIVERNGENAVSVKPKKVKEQPKQVNAKTNDILLESDESWDSEEEMEKQSEIMKVKDKIPKSANNTSSRKDNLKKEAPQPMNICPIQNVASQPKVTKVTTSVDSLLPTYSKSDNKQASLSIIPEEFEAQSDVSAGSCSWLDEKRDVIKEEKVNEDINESEDSKEDLNNPKEKHVMWNGVDVYEYEDVTECDDGNEYEDSIEDEDVIEDEEVVEYDEYYIHDESVDAERALLIAAIEGTPIEKDYDKEYMDHAPTDEMEKNEEKVPIKKSSTSDISDNEVVYKGCIMEVFSDNSVTYMSEHEHEKWLARKNETVVNLKNEVKLAKNNEVNVQHSDKKEDIIEKLSNDGVSNHIIEKPDRSQASNVNSTGKRPLSSQATALKSEASPLGGIAVTKTGMMPLKQTNIMKGKQSFLEASKDIFALEKSIASGKLRSPVEKTNVMAKQIAPSNVPPKRHGSLEPLNLGNNVKVTTPQRHGTLAPLCSENIASIAPQQTHGALAHLSSGNAASHAPQQTHGTSVPPGSRNAESHAPPPPQRHGTLAPLNSGKAESQTPPQRHGMLAPLGSRKAESLATPQRLGALAPLDSGKDHLLLPPQRHGALAPLGSEKAVSIAPPQRHGALALISSEKADAQASLQRHGTLTPLNSSQDTTMLNPQVSFAKKAKKKEKSQKKKDKKAKIGKKKKELPPVVVDGLGTAYHKHGEILPFEKQTFQHPLNHSGDIDVHDYDDEEFQQLSEAMINYDYSQNDPYSGHLHPDLPTEYVENPYALLDIPEEFQHNPEEYLRILEEIQRSEEFRSQNQHMVGLHQNSPYANQRHQRKNENISKEPQDIYQNVSLGRRKLRSGHQDMPHRLGDIRGYQQSIPPRGFQGMPGIHPNLPLRHQGMPGVPHAIPRGYQGMPDAQLDLPREYQLPGAHHDLFRGYMDMPDAHRDIPHGYQGMPDTHRNLPLGYKGMPGAHHGLAQEYHDTPLVHHNLRQEHHRMPHDHQYMPRPFHEMQVGYERMMGDPQSVPSEHQGDHGKSAKRFLKSHRSQQSQQDTHNRPSKKAEGKEPKTTPGIKNIAHEKPNTPPGTRQNVAFEIPNTPPGARQQNVAFEILNTPRIHQENVKKALDIPEEHLRQNFRNSLESRQMDDDFVVNNEYETTDSERD